MTFGRRAATQLLRPLGTRVVTVRDGPLAGARMQLELATEKRFWAGRHEPSVQATIAALDLAGRNAWDLGAHIGFFSLLLARRGASVLAVEANPETVARLRRNVALNDAPVEVVEAAVSGQSGTVRFSARPGPERAQSAIRDDGTLEVRAVTLDALLAEYGVPSFVKLDVEGAELDALLAAPQLLAARPVIHCELHVSAEQGDAVHRLLAEAGYRIERRPWSLDAFPN